VFVGLVSVWVVCTGRAKNAGISDTNDCSDYSTPQLTGFVIFVTVVQVSRASRSILHIDSKVTAHRT
jgi:hypothetical protein